MTANVTVNFTLRQHVSNDVNFQKDQKTLTTVIRSQ